MRDPLEGIADADPQTLQMFEQSLAAAAPRQPVTKESIVAARAAMPAAAGIPGAIKRSINGPGGPIDLEIVTPERIEGVYLHIHGGGWCGGRGNQHDLETVLFAERYPVAVVNVRYRLAPEHPFPAGPDDCEAAAAWLVANAPDEFGTDRIVIGGESAGAHLSVVTTLRMRDRHGYTGFAGAQLCYGAYDLRLTPSSRSFPYPFLDRKALEEVLDLVVPDVARREDPDVSPIFASLHDMPPALFTVGTLDSLLDDTLFMWTRWRAAGNTAEIEVYPGGRHGFDNSPTDFGRRARDRMWSFMAQQLGATETTAAHH